MGDTEGSRSLQVVIFAFAPVSLAPAWRWQRREATRAR